MFELVSGHASIVTRTDARAKSPKARSLERDREAWLRDEAESGWAASRDLELVGLEIERRAVPPAPTPPRVDNLNLYLKLDATLGQSGHF
jgi:hypothetical protein